MIKRLILILVFVLQICVPVYMILQRENVLATGVLVKFQVEPVDPYDAFRGKYLNIGLKEDLIKTKDKSFGEDRKVYISLSVDEKGFAHMEDVSYKPYMDKLYFTGTIDETGQDFVIIKPPFNRYYINEEYAGKAEKLYNKLSHDNPENVYITVRIKKGKTVVDQMFLNGTDIYSYIESKE